MALDDAHTARTSSFVDRGTSTFEDALQSHAKTRNLFVAAAISNICVFFFGTTVGWTSPSEILVLKQKAFEFKPTKEQWNWICSMLPLGALLCSLPMGAIMKNFGCKPLMMIQVLPYSCGWLLLIYAKNIYMLFVGRFLQGMCGAAVCLAVPVYLDEISQWQYRGFIGCFFFGALLYGIIYSNLMLAWISLRTFFIINLVIIPIFALLIIIPESPIRYICNEKFDKAYESLEWLRSKHYDVEEELIILVEWINNENVPTAGFWDDLKHVTLLGGVLRSSVLMSLHQAAGGIVVILYLDYILQDITKRHYSFKIIWICFCMFLGHLTCVLLVEKLGRRPLLMFSSIVMAVCAVYLCCWFKWSLSNGLQPLTGLVMCAFIASYCMGLGPIACLLNVEMNLATVRHYGCAIANICAWLTIFLISEWFNFASHSHIIFYLTIVSCLIVFLVTIVFIPETKGVSPYNIKRSLESNRQESFSSLD